MNMILIGGSSRRKEVNLDNVEEIEWHFPQPQEERDPNYPKSAAVVYSSGNKWFVGEAWVRQLWLEVREAQS